MGIANSFQACLAFLFICLLAHVSAIDYTAGSSYTQWFLSGERGCRFATLLPKNKTTKELRLRSPGRRHVDPDPLDCDAASARLKELVDAGRATVIDRTNQFHPGTVSFKIAVLTEGDAVSNAIRTVGGWEGGDSVSLFQKVADWSCKHLDLVPTFVDVGANLGFHTIVALALGLEVISFEPFDLNLDLLRASVCLNPGFRERLTLYPIALGPRHDDCVIASTEDNRGNGHLVCERDFGGSEALRAFLTSASLQERSRVQMVELQETDIPVPMFSYMKIDVERFEYLALLGAKRWMMSRYRPVGIRSEAWARLANGTTRADYVSYLQYLGYDVFSLFGDLLPYYEAPGFSSDIMRGSMVQEFMELDIVRVPPRRLRKRRRSALGGADPKSDSATELATEATRGQAFTTGTGPEHLERTERAERTGDRRAVAGVLEGEERVGEEGMEEARLRSRERSAAAVAAGGEERRSGDGSGGAGLGEQRLAAGGSVLSSGSGISGSVSVSAGRGGVGGARDHRTHSEGGDGTREHEQIIQRDSDSEVDHVLESESVVHRERLDLTRRARTRAGSGEGGTGSDDSDVAKVQELGG